MKKKKKKASVTQGPGTTLSGLARIPAGWAQPAPPTPTAPAFSETGGEENWYLS